MSTWSSKSIAAFLLCASAALWPAFAADRSGADGAIPILSGASNMAWMEIGDELLPPVSGAGPVTNDPRYPYVDNGEARRRGIQPTYRIADLNNPILQPWAKEQMRKAK